MALVMFVLYPTVESCHLYWRPSQSSCDVSTIKEKKKKLSFTPRYFVAQTCYSHFYDGFFYTLLPFKFEIEVIKKIGWSMLNSG